MKIYDVRNGRAQSISPETEVEDEQEARAREPAYGEFTLYRKILDDNGKVLKTLKHPWELLPEVKGGFRSIDG